MKRPSPGGDTDTRPSITLELERVEAQSLHHAAAYMLDVVGGRGVPTLTAAYARLDALLEPELAP